MRVLKSHKLWLEDIAEHLQTPNVKATVGHAAFKPCVRVTHGEEQAIVMIGMENGQPHQVHVMARKPNVALAVCTASGIESFFEASEHTKIVPCVTVTLFSESEGFADLG